MSCKSALVLYVGSKSACLICLPDRRYFEKQWTNFNAAMLEPANGDGGHKGTTFGFWNTTQHLFCEKTQQFHPVF